MPSKLLLTGATGFIGGTVLHQLLNTSDPGIKSLSITAVVRKPADADRLAKEGLQTVLVNGLDDDEALEQAASKHDIVVNVATGFHATSTKSLIRGLGKRREQTGKDVYYLHLSGTTCVSVPATRESPFELRAFSDRDEDIYEYELLREAYEPYAQRTAEVAAIETGELCQVKTYIVMPPTVYGRGTGFFRTQSHQIPTLIRNALKTGYAEHVETGVARLGHVHVEDLARLYALLVSKVVEGASIVSGRHGYYFADTGYHLWSEVTSEIGKVGHELGVLKSPMPRAISLEDAAHKFADGDVKYAEACFASNSHTRTEKAYDLGWRPVNTESDFVNSIRITVEDVLKEQEQNA
ncbi:NAD dependent epimerase/dehydratase [Penicillium argentinense]|uniref:NAD dependent epimerase/dehydratase n=1 Tax=Penicillium argentinense TaxID=1131581 RepID=A0A9W9EWI2_9EURO|nr:NAD dependent epimerase/dehydratase [Penicillium argentinense]KAJ5089150.1 NAD dependent epimerase/dehydratase [Penicillium argentinense]